MFIVILISLDGLFFEYEAKGVTREEAIRLACIESKILYIEEFTLFRVEEHY